MAPTDVNAGCDCIVYSLGRLGGAGYVGRDGIERHHALSPGTKAFLMATSEHSYTHCWRGCTWTGVQRPLRPTH
jgi:hypothetical protein